MLGHDWGVFKPFSRWRQRAARGTSSASINKCQACGHNWGEHGFDNDVDGVCGECSYEIEHGLRLTDQPGCRLTPAPAFGDPTSA